MIVCARRNGQGIGFFFVVVGYMRLCISFVCVSVL